MRCLTINLAFLLFSFFFIPRLGCAQSPLSSEVIIGRIIDSTKRAFDTTGKSQSERLKKLMELSMLKDLVSTHKQLIERSGSLGFTVSEIRRSGDYYEYTAANADSSLLIRSSYFPKNGKSEKYIVGTKNLVENQFKQTKAMIAWDFCKEDKDGKLCFSKQQIEQVPIITHLNLSLAYIGENEASVTMLRFLEEKL